jgi:hypothetical protein
MDGIHFDTEAFLDDLHSIGQADNTFSIFFLCSVAVVTAIGVVFICIAHRFRRRRYTVQTDDPDEDPLDGLDLDDFHDDKL